MYDVEVEIVMPHMIFSGAEKITFIYGLIYFMWGIFYILVISQDKISKRYWKDYYESRE
jgi:hypothetical protein